ncbi:flagellar biosynthetic protein FliR [Pontivivens insulae]|uniref:Flagellar biosynthetic protein FliR n=1 Tax=Pontivivens insulae TaxID=1639689 RepID=A0A2R8A9F6_9RHOB|nr:flagellar biosynthetic protein FliR [Pontivivens insulae]RED12776.1 flagellar biosynthetic protein FliR [Pontivivens insulae]SPF28867.1 hypothetical protein POI8812_01170 [Pontivivens insulae]
METAVITFAALQDGLALGILVFARVAAIAALLPGFGGQGIPARVRIAVALSFTMITAPLIPMPQLSISLAVLGAEIAVGVLIGLGLRLLVMALQFAGSIAAQSTSIAQILGAGATPDPLPAMGNILVLAGITLALAAGLHLRVVEAIVLSYRFVPAGIMPGGDAVAEWGLSHVARAFQLGFTLSAPFLVAGLAYNLALGAINRAMPQLMVAFVGAPAITGGGIALLMLSAPALLTAWHEVLQDQLTAPLGLAP